MEISILKRHQFGYKHFPQKSETI